ncbi:chemotaxis protein CheW [Noviherbaspirillum agri]
MTPQADEASITASAERRDYLTFRVGEREYGIALENVRELTTYCAVTPVAGAPRTVAGMVTLRSHRLPVLNLREVLALEDNDESKLNDVVVVQNGDRMSGIAVDCVLDVQSLGQEQVRTRLRACDAETGLLDGIATLDRRVVSLLNTRKLIRDDLTASAGRFAA